MIGHRTSPGRTVRFVVVPLATFLVTAGVVWRASYASFDPSSGSAAATGGSVTLTDDAHGTPLFAPDALVPGSSGTRCIEVTSTAGDPGEVRMYISHLVTSSAHLEEHLYLTVEQGAGGTSQSCMGFVADGAPIIDHQSFATAAADHHDYATGAGSFTTRGDTTGESVSYQIRWVFDTTGMSPGDENAMMGAASGIDFQWEIQGR